MASISEKEKTSAPSPFCPSLTRGCKHSKTTRRPVVSVLSICDMKLVVFLQLVIISVHMPFYIKRHGISLVHQMISNIALRNQMNQYKSKCTAVHGKLLSFPVDEQMFC